MTTTVEEELDARPRVTGVAMRKGETVMSMEPPNRHHNIISEINMMQGNPAEWEQGFVDTDGVFLNRRQAASRALRTGQVGHLTHMELFSEDLW